MSTIEKTFTFLWLGPLNDIQIKKDFQIPIILAKMGYFTNIIVRNISLSIENSKKLNDKNLNLISLDKLNIKLYNFLAIFNLIKNSDVILVLHPINSYLLLPLILIRFYNKIIRKRKFLLIGKLDIGGPIRGRNALTTFLLLVILLLIPADVFIAESTCATEAVKKQLHGLVGKLKRFITIPNGYDKEIVKINVNSSKENLILTVARINPIKGLDIAIKAFKELENQIPYEIGKWKYYIVGPIEDESYYNNLLNLINDDDKIKIIGEVDEEYLSYLYSISSIFVLPSYHEGLSIARMEAAAYGLPVITTDTPCKEDLEKYGFIVIPKGSIKELKEKLKELILKPEERIRVSSRQHVPSWDDVVNLLLNFINTHS